MRYELHIPGTPPARFETEHEVIDAAAKAIRLQRSARPAVIDLATGQPARFSDRRISHEEYQKSLSL